MGWVKQFRLLDSASLFLADKVFPARFGHVWAGTSQKRLIWAAT